MQASAVKFEFIVLVEGVPLEVEERTGSPEV